MVDPPAASPPPPPPKTAPRALPVRVLAVDYGNVFTGLAIGPGPGSRPGAAPTPLSQPPPPPSSSSFAAAGPATGLLDAPRPLRVVRSQGRAVGLLARDVVAEARAQGASAVLIGVPLSRGQRLADAAADSPQASRCREFAHNAALVAAAAAVDVYIYGEATPLFLSSALRAGGGERNEKPLFCLPRGNFS